MLQNSQNEQIQKLGNWISPRLEKYELVLLLFFLVSFILKVSANLPVGILMILSLFSLGALYFFYAFSTTGDKNAGPIEIFVFKLSLIGMAEGIIGILFTFQHWPGSDMMILIAGIILSFSLVIILILKFRKPELKIFSLRFILRIIVIATLVIVLNQGLFSPQFTAN